MTSPFQHNLKCRNPWPRLWSYFCPLSGLCGRWQKTGKKILRQLATFILIIATICNLGLPVNRLYAGSPEAETADPWPRQTIGIIAVPNLTAADQVGQLLSEEFKKRFTNAPQTSLTLDVFHMGDIKDFPPELSWLINHAKHAETDPRVPNNIQVELHLVSERQFSEALLETQDQLDNAYRTGESLAASLQLAIADLERSMEELSQLAIAVDREKSPPNALTTNTDSEFQRRLQMLRSRLAELSGVITSANGNWLERLPWRQLSDWLDQLSEFSHFWRERAPLIYRLAHHTPPLPNFDRKLYEQVQRIVRIGEEAQSAKLLIERLALDISYSPHPQNGASIQGESLAVDQPQAPTQSRFRQADLRLRHLFGLPNGLSWIMYKLSFTERSIHEHVIEFGSALIQASITYGINYASIAAKLAENPELYLNPSAGAAVSATWKLLTGYIERANNAFFVQGVNYDPISEFTTNRSFFMLSAYAHSLLIGVTVQLAVRGLAGFTPDILLHTAWNSFLGLFAKAVPLMLIAKHQRKHYEVEDTSSLHHSKWKTIAFNFLFGIGYQSLKAVHFYQINFWDLDVVFVVLGLAGLGYELGKWIHAGTQEVATQTGTLTRSQYRFYKFTQALSIGQEVKKKRTCRTLFLFPQPTRY